MDIAVLRGPIAVTLAYLLLYYLLQAHLLRVKARLSAEYKRRGEVFDRYFGQDREMLAADRFQLNTLEHMPPFLALLWMNALFVGPRGATIAGAIYVVARAAYPFAAGSRFGHNVRLAVVFATTPAYLVLIYFAGALVWALVG